MSGATAKKPSPEAGAPATIPETAGHKPAEGSDKSKKVPFYTAEVHTLIDDVINGSSSFFVHAIREACKKGKIKDIEKTIKKEEYIDPENALRICDAINRSIHFSPKEGDELHKKVLKKLKFKRADESSLQGVYAVVRGDNKKSLAKEMRKFGISPEPQIPAATPAAIAASTAAATAAAAHTAHEQHAPETPIAMPAPAATPTTPPPHATPAAAPHTPAHTPEQHTAPQHVSTPTSAAQHAPETATHTRVAGHTPAANDNTEEHAHPTEHQEGTTNNHTAAEHNNDHDDHHGHKSYLVRTVHFIGKVVTFVYNEISPGIEKTVNVTANVATGILSLDIFKEGFEIASDATISVGKGVGRIAGKFAVNSANAITWPFKKIGKGIGSIWSSITKAIKNRKEKRTAARAARAATGKKKWHIGTGIKNGLKKVGSAIGSGFRSVGSGIANVGRSIGSGIAKGWSAFTGLFKRNKKTS